MYRVSDDNNVINSDVDCMMNSLNDGVIMHMDVCYELKTLELVKRKNLV